MPNLHTPWMMHDMEDATVVTTEKRGRTIAVFDGSSFTDDENQQHAELAMAGANRLTSSDACDCPTFIALYYNHNTKEYITEECYDKEDATAWLSTEEKIHRLPQPAIIQIHFDGTISVEQWSPDNA